MPPRKNVPLCAVKIGFQTLLLPASEGMKVVALLANAMSCHEVYEDGTYVYEVEEQVQVTYKSIRPGQVLQPVRHQPRLLEHLGD